MGSSYLSDMTTDTEPRAGVEWGGGDDLERDDRGWPILRPTEDGRGTCDGINPMTGRDCLLGHHSGYHRDSHGAEWLDE